MKYTVCVANAFTSNKIATLGNPAGTVILAELLSKDEMSKIAEKAGLPITAFLVPKNAEKTEYTLRYYDLGGRECHICGHATVAASAQLAEMFPELDGQKLTFHLNPDQFEGELVTLATRVSGPEISIDLPASKLRHENDPKLTDTICKGLGIRPKDIDSIAFSVNVRDYVVGLKDLQTLLGMKPDFEFLKRMAEVGDYTHEGMMVSAPASGESGFDLHVRVFLPITGVNEDVACGSGNCSIIPYWHQKGLKNGERIFKSVFPFPGGREGYVGGVQDVSYDVEQGRITIVSQATLYPKMTIYLDDLPLEEGVSFFSRPWVAALTP